MSDTAVSVYQPMRAIRVLQRGVTQAISLPIYDVAHTLIEPASGTFTLLDASGSPVVSELAVNVVSDIAVVSITASDLPATTSTGQGWLEVWSLVVSGETVVVRREAAVAKGATLQPITSHDMIAYMPGFENAAIPWAWIIEEATAEVMGAIADLWRVVNVVGAVPCIRHLAAALAYEGAGVDYLPQASYQRELYKASRTSWVIRYDDNGQVSASAGGFAVSSRQRRVVA